MKSTSLSAAALVFLMPALALAAQWNSANLELDQAVTVAGTQIPPGQYKVSWETNGPEVTVSFADGNKTVVTALAKLVSSTTSQEAIETDSAGGGTPVLNAIDLKHVTIRFKNAIPFPGD